jgi:hypothetical protein
MKTIYKGDSRYEKIHEQMQLLNIQDVSSPTQVKNGTIVWRLPMKGRGNTHIEYASFQTGYVRNQGNQCHSNWQINTRVDDEPRYFELPNGDYRKYVGKVCKMIPIEIDRLEYMMKYVIKNEFIKRANYAHNSIAKSQHIDSIQASESYYKHKLRVAQENAEFHEKRADELCKTVVEHGIDNQVKDVQVIIDGHKYKLI